ncbi:MAG TPA: hypothetical protein VGF63_06800 [Solirubrobacteraceae bacterium]
MHAATAATAGNSDVPLDGPSLTIDVPTDAMLMWYGTAKIDAPGGATGTVWFDAPDTLGAKIYLIGGFSGTSPVSSFLRAPAAPLANQTGAFGDWQNFVVAPGTHTFSFGYDCSGGPCSFSERELWIAVLT